MLSFQFVSRVISASFFVISIFAILLQVIFRYLLQWPLGWTTEVAINAFMIGSWWTICWNVRLGDHVAIGLVFNHLPVFAQRLCQVITGLFAGGMLLIALPGCLKYLEIVNRLVTGVLNVPLSWIHSIFALFLVVVGLRLLYSAVQSLRLFYLGITE